MRSLRTAGVRTAVVTASPNASWVLAVTGLDELFDVPVDSEDTAALNLPGNPDPATYLEAIRRLNVSPDRAVIVEDALPGVEAGRRGGFGSSSTSIITSCVWAAALQGAPIRISFAGAVHSLAAGRHRTAPLTT